MFQWYTHGVRGDRRKADELTRIYPVAGSGRDLASDTWDTCEPHKSARFSMFLPWHRAYVLAFERLIRAISGEPTFTLPYWNYSPPGSARSLPSEFRQEGDPVLGSLYRADRYPEVNQGRPIDEAELGDPLSLVALRERDYAVHNDPEAGFNAVLDQGLHGNLHGLVGDGRGMGAVAWAAADPIFWLHHCNIDRLWASWNKNGHSNPTAGWDDQFVFADEQGRRVQFTTAGVSDIGALSYSYDYLEPPLAEREAAVNEGEPRVIGIGRGTGREAAGIRVDRRVTIPLQPQQEANRGFREAVRSSPRRFVVVVRGRAALTPPEGLFQVFLDLPPDASPQKKKEHFAGSFNFFGVGGHHQVGQLREYRIDVTEALRERAAPNALPSITIIPSRKDVNGQPTIKEVVLIER
jgi:tyrosinase